ncbi:MAG TPA: protein kinase [Polyangiaceae bacterium]|nr:protein kinase [Polyangiaceae bacterium]
MTVQDPSSVPFDRVSSPSSLPHIRIEPGVVLLQRFEVGRKLGQGSVGQVFAAFDREHQREVALKVLGQLTPAAIAELKTEFRAVSELVHPNLVRFFELFCEGVDWFFTMELVTGEQLSALQVERSLSDEDQREVFRQLAIGLSVLHASGKLHRDLKPSNFLVADGGKRVVLLDFGLAQPIGQASASGFTGTPAYMAPEQYWGNSLSEAADWYAFGVVLYEALTGNLPGRMPSLSPLSNAPQDLAQLCVELLNLDEKRRPTGSQVLERLSARALSNVDYFGRHSSSILINRQVELDLLEAAFSDTLAGRPNVVVVSGPSGIGKTTLVEHFLHTARANGAAVLACRCRERESMSFKAIDGLIDELVTYLEELPIAVQEEILPRGIAELSVLFPALRAVPAVASVAWPSFETSDRALLRLRAIQAFAELILRLRRSGPLVLWIDDLQWSDQESALLLEPVLGGPAQAPILLIGSCRDSTSSESSHDSVQPSGVMGQPLLRALSDNPRFALPPPQQIVLQPLSNEDAERIALSILGTEAPNAREQARAIARDTGGHPLFVKELAFIKAAPERNLASGDPATFAELIELRLASIEPSACAVVETLALAVSPLSRGIIRSVRQMGAVETEQALDRLRSVRLVRSWGLKEEDQVDVYHDRVREVVVQRLNADQRKAGHAALALALQAQPNTTPEVLAHHFEAAAEPSRAAHYWQRAADAAMDNLAFDHAADLFQRAQASCRDEPERVRALGIQRAEALSYAGKGPGAAEVYLALAAEASDPVQAVELQRRAAEQLLLSGHIERGIDLMKDVAVDAGIGTLRTSRQALLSVAVGRVLLSLRGVKYRLKAKTQIDARQLVKLDVAWTVSCSLSMIDPLNGAHFHNKHLSLALDTGEPRHLLRALALETSYVATKGRAGAKRDEQLQKATRELMHLIGDPMSQSLFDLGRGISAYLQGKTRQALVDCEAALQSLKEHSPGAAWETVSALRFVVASLFILGHYKRLRDVVPPLLASAEGTGNRYASMCFRSAFSTVAWLVGDEPDEAQRQLERARTECNPDRFYLPHYNLLLGETFYDLYQGNIPSAHERWAQHWPQLVGSQLLRIAVIRLMVWELRAACACAAALSADQQGDRPKGRWLRALAQRYTRKLKADRSGRDSGAPLLLEAAMHAQEGHADVARRLLERAADRFDAAERRMYAAAARMRLSRFVPGVRGRALWLAGYRVFQDEGVVDLERMLNLLAPGYPVVSES